MTWNTSAHPAESIYITGATFSVGGALTLSVIGLLEQKNLWNPA